MNGLEYIRYSINTNNGIEIRDMVVINGQPFYRSTGLNSELPGVWLPFICVRGKDETIDFHKITSQNQFPMQIMLVLSQTPEQYIIKYASLYNVHAQELGLLVSKWSHSPSFQRFNNRNFMKLFNRCVSLECLATSCALGGGFWNEQALKSIIIQEMLDKKTPESIQLKEKPTFETNDTRKINQWLCQSGATYAKLIFKNVEPQPDNTIHNSLSSSASIPSPVQIPASQVKKDSSFVLSSAVVNQDKKEKKDMRTSKLSISITDSRTLLEIYQDQKTSGVTIDPSEYGLVLAIDGGYRVPISRKYDNVPFNVALKDIAKTLRDQTPRKIYLTDILDGNNNGNWIHHYDLWDRDSADKLETILKLNVAESNSSMLISAQAPLVKEKTDSVLSNMAGKQKLANSSLQSNPAASVVNGIAFFSQSADEYSKFPEGFRRFLSEKTEEACTMLGISTREYWGQISTAEQSKLKGEYNNNLLTPADSFTG